MRFADCLLTRWFAGLTMILPGLLASGSAANQPTPTRRPNFVVVLGEGHGWASTSVPMDDSAPNSRSLSVDTPNLEKLAAAGMRFASFYAPSPRCTPSRATILTGVSPARLHMTFVGEGRSDTGGADAGKALVPPDCLLELPQQTTTIAELLQRAGYGTAHYGKWHLGRVRPERHGFDESDGATNNGGPDNVPNPHPKQLYAMTARGLDFMTRQVRAGKPFYLQLSHYASRRGGDASPNALAATRQKHGNLNESEAGRVAADVDLDIALGMVLQKLDELGIANNTFVIYTTDHGTPGRNPPLNGGKGTVWDGGLRVPFIIRGPGIAPGSCSHVRALGADLLPTLAELAGVTERIPAEVEGGTLVPALVHSGQGAVTRSRQEYVVHFPHYDKDSRGPASALLLGNFKLIRVFETGRVQLFDLSTDPGERHDLAADMPGKAQELDGRLSDYLTAVNAQMPVPNPDYDGTANSPVPRGRSGKNRGAVR